MRWYYYNIGVLLQYLLIYELTGISTPSVPVIVTTGAGLPLALHKTSYSSFSIMKYPSPFS